MKKVAVVILNWNGVKMLRQYLPQVIEYSREEADVYVADNASTDDSVDMLKTLFPEVKLILLERNWGFAEGYNKALAQIDAEYYLLLNSDIEVTPHWLTPLISHGTFIFFRVRHCLRFQASYLPASSFTYSTNDTLSRTVR